MAMSGMEQMIVSLVSKMGLDPEAIKATIVNVQDKVVEMADTQKRVEAKLDAILSKLEAV